MFAVERVDLVDKLGKHVDMEAPDRHIRPDPVVPYNDLPPPPSGSRLESRVALKHSIAARDQLARVRAASMRLPDPSIIINAIPLLEARDSSRIENIVTTSDDLFRHQANTAGAEDPATKEALRYRAALLASHQSLQARPITTRTAIDIASILLGSEQDIRRVPGTALTHAATGDIVYTPPVGEALIRDKLGAWERFVHDDDIDALVRMAASHYQFEAIHPFTDGNGRTGRILNSLLLVHYGLLDHPLLYLSRYILEHRDDYYRLLSGVTFDDEWEQWIEFMLDGVRETANWTAMLIELIGTLATATEAHVRMRLPTAHAHDLVNVLFTAPYARIGNVVDAGIAKRQTASEYLQRLVDAGVLDVLVVGREKLFLNRRLLTLLAGSSSWEPFSPG